MFSPQMFCEPTLWSMTCNAQAEKTQEHSRDPVCLVEISSDRSTTCEEMCEERWISEHKTPSKLDHQKCNTQRSTISQFLPSVRSAVKFWTFLHVGTATQTWEKVLQKIRLFTWNKWTSQKYVLYFVVYTFF